MEQLSFFDDSFNKNNFSELDVVFKEFTIRKVKKFLNRNLLFEHLLKLYTRFYSGKMDSLKFENSIYRLETDLDKKFSKEKERLVGYDYPVYNPLYELGLSFVKISYEESKKQFFYLAETLAKLAVYS